jgi:hypothetical protein
MMEGTSKNEWFEKDDFMTVKTLRIENLLVGTETVDLAWRKFFRAGALAGLLIILTGLLDIVIMFLPWASANPGARSVLDWYVLLQSNPFLALRDMGLLNMITMSCSVFVFFGLYGLHRRINPLGAVLALILVCLGAAIYIANNSALPMLTLSQHYTAAASESQKAVWVSAGQALLAHEDLTAGAFPGFFFGEIAAAWMAWVALRGGVFQRWEACLGLVATGCLFFFNLCAAFIPALYDSVMPIFGAGGGLLSLVWYILIVRRLFLAR